MKPDDQLIAEVRELDAKATKGYWAADWGRVRDDNCGTICRHPSSDNAFGPKWEGNKNFIAAARDLLPDLANRLEAANERDKARWRPVEEAKDGEQILLKTKYGIIEVTWDAENQCGDLYISHDMQLYGNVFMPLPEPPTKPTP